MRRGFIGLVAALALVVGACGGDDDTLSESEVKDRLIEEGLSEDLADCVAGEIGSISAGDEAELYDGMFEAGQKCAADAVGEIPDFSVPDFSIPDISIPDISIDLPE